MPIIVGIDEAGYGPTLGPLVTTAVALDVPDPDVDLWHALAPTVCRVGAGRSTETILVDDSKRVYGSSRQFRHLERSVLAFLADGPPLPCRLDAWLPAVGVARPGHLTALPWYAQLDLGLPHAADVDDVAAASRRLRECLAAAGIRCLGARAIPCPAPDLNVLFARLNNKSLALFALVTRLLRLAWQRADEQPVRVFLDKHGGRHRYRPLLQSAFPDHLVTVRGETAERSGYRLTSGRRAMDVTFEPRADARHFAVALASMTSKYVRELLMRLLNRFWAARVPGLRPTAGYPQDARRFLADIAPVRERLNVRDEQLVRSR